MLFDPDRVTLPSGLASSAQAGARFLLTRLAQDSTLAAAPAGLQWAAYMLATVEHETWRRFTPVEEVGLGHGHPYGVAIKTLCADGTVRMNQYYGRGYVQLTWQDNYLRLGEALGLGRQLVEQPALVLQPNIACQILSYGMVNGAFTGKRISDYITLDSTNYIQARRVINSLDRAEQIAELAKQWEMQLRSVPAHNASVTRS